MLVMQLLLIQVGCQWCIVNVIAMTNLCPGCHVLVVDFANSIAGIELKNKNVNKSVTNQL